MFKLGWPEIHPKFLKRQDTLILSTALYPANCFYKKKTSAVLLFHTSKELARFRSFSALHFFFSNFSPCDAILQLPSCSWLFLVKFRKKSFVGHPDNHQYIIGQDLGLDFKDFA